MADSLETTRIQWHPGFYGAAEIEFLSNKGDLEFHQEYTLSKEPIRMDLLVIKKPANVRIQNELGHIFKKYNVVEYKSPEDGLTIDDYFKTVGYACLYKGLGASVNEIPAEELTISIFREVCPRELFDTMTKAGFEIEKRYPGIYYIYGKQVLFETQIVVTSQLDRELHRTLRILSKNVQEEDARAFIEAALCLTEPGDRNNIDAVLQVSVSANQALYEMIRRDGHMCDALKNLMKEEIEEERVKARAEAKAEAKQQTLLEAIENLMQSMKWTAEQAMSALNIPAGDWPQYMAKL